MTSDDERESTLTHDRTQPKNKRELNDHILCLVCGQGIKNDEYRRCVCVTNNTAQMFRQRKIRYFSISKFTIFLSNACGNAGGICKSRKGGEEELYSVLYSASQQCPAPGKASPALHWATLSRRQLCASQHLFVSGCQEIMDWDVVTFISLIVTPCEM